MLPQQYCLRWKYHHSNLQTMFSQLLDRGCFCDVTLACEGQLIRAHRVVLCACSTFFDTMLTNYASERDPIIIMKDATFADVKCLIEFMYKGEINVEHASLASLLKTADDLKIKGLAEVSWREDDDGGLPPPVPATEFNSPKRALGANSHELQRASPALGVEGRGGSDTERRSASPLAAQTRLPPLTPIPAASNIAIAASAMDQYLGPKRKRGRPPLDDAYDVFNVRKMAQYAAHMDHQAYLEATRHYDEEQQRQHHGKSSPSTVAAVAYQEHIHQQQSKQRLRNRHQQHQQNQPQQSQPENEETEHQTDSEWITSNLEVQSGSCDQQHLTDHCTEDEELELPKIRLHKMEIEKHEKPQQRKLDKKNIAKTPEQKEKAKERINSRKNSNEQNSTHEQTLAERDTEPHPQAQSVKVDDNDAEVENAGMEHSVQQQQENVSSTVPQPVEEMESVQQVREQQGKTVDLPTSSVNTTPTTSTFNSCSTASTSFSLPHKTHSSLSTASSRPPPPMHHHTHFGKYAPEGYLLNEHGMLMTHDFVHATTAAIPVPSLSVAAAAAATSSGAAANGSDHEYADIKMEDFDGADLRLTSEELTQWQDVIKMDDYLAKGRRPQFWEEPFTRRVLDAIKNKRLEMKKAARILGVSYGTLYGRYREVYGCLKHPYSSGTTAFRPSQQLAVPPRLDIVWPTPKRDATALLPGA